MKILGVKKLTEVRRLDQFAAVEGARDPQILIDTAAQCLNADASIIMIESEGITENADPWCIDVAARIMKEIGMENVMFEAADPAVFEWYIKNYGVGVSFLSVIVRSYSWSAYAAAFRRRKAHSAASRVIGDLL